MLEGISMAFPVHKPKPTSISQHCVKNSFSVPSFYNNFVVMLHVFPTNMEYLNIILSV